MPSHRRRVFRPLAAFAALIVAVGLVVWAGQRERTARDRAEAEHARGLWDARHEATVAADDLQCRQLATAAAVWLAGLGYGSAYTNEVLARDPDYVQMAGRYERAVGRLNQIEGR